MSTSQRTLVHEPVQHIWMVNVAIWLEGFMLFCRTGLWIFLCRWKFKHQILLATVWANNLIVIYKHKPATTEQQLLSQQCCFNPASCPCWSLSSHQDSAVPSSLQPVLCPVCSPAETPPTADRVFILLLLAGHGHTNASVRTPTLLHPPGPSCRFFQGQITCPGLLSVFCPVWQHSNVKW